MLDCGKLVTHCGHLLAIVNSSLFLFSCPKFLSISPPVHGHFLLTNCFPSQDPLVCGKKEYDLWKGKGVGRLQGKGDENEVDEGFRLTHTLKNFTAVVYGNLETHGESTKLFWGPGEKTFLHLSGCLKEGIDITILGAESPE